MQTSVLHPTTLTQGWRGEIIKSLVEAFGLYPKCRRFKERTKIITLVIQKDNSGSCSENGLKGLRLEAGSRG